MTQYNAEYNKDSAGVKGASEWDGTRWITPVTVNGSNAPKITIETIINAGSVASNSFIEGTIPLSTETEMWVAITIDKAPWTARSSSLFYGGGDGATPLYPTRVNVDTAYPSLLLPCISFLMKGISTDTMGLPVPGSFAEAKAMSIGFFGSPLFRVFNYSSETATVTVRVIRVWR